MCIISLHFRVFCLLIVLVEFSVLAKLLARKTPVRKPNLGEQIVSTSPQSPDRRVFMIFLVYCIVSLFYDVLMCLSFLT